MPPIINFRRSLARPLSQCSSTFHAVRMASTIHCIMNVDFCCKQCERAARDIRPALEVHVGHDGARDVCSDGIARMPCSRKLLPQSLWQQFWWFSVSGTSGRPGSAAPESNTSSGPVICRVMEAFEDGKLGVRAIIFHQRDKADGPRLGSLLLAHYGQRDGIGNDRRPALSSHRLPRKKRLRPRVGAGPDEQIKTGRA